MSPAGIASLLVSIWLASAVLGESHKDWHHRHNSYRSLHTSRYGEAISDYECQSRDKTAELQEILDGKKLPYAFRGPDADCDAEGCKHNYWGARCRFDGQHSPTCSMAQRWTFTSWMTEHAKNGAQWAKDFLTMKPCDIWPQIRGRTLWIIGDSISQDMVNALSCFLVEYFSPTGREIQATPEIMSLLSHPHPTTGAEVPPWCFNLAQDTRICQLRANRAPRLANTALHLLPSVADRENDIVLMNFGAWYNKVDEQMSDLREDIPLFEQAVNSLRSLLPIRLLWRETTAQHFDTPSGMFNGSKAINEQRCSPPGSHNGAEVVMFTDGSLGIRPGAGQPLNWTEYDIMIRGGRRNLATQPIVDRLGLETVAMYNLSLAAYSVHHGYHTAGLCVEIDCDCTHACLPSWYEMSFPALSKALRRLDSSLTAPTLDS